MTIPDKNKDNFEEDKSLSDGEEWEDDLDHDEHEASSESDIGEGDHDKVEDEFDGEDGEEPWGIDEYMAEGYAPP